MASGPSGISALSVQVAGSITASFPCVPIQPPFTAIYTLSAAPVIPAQSPDNPVIYATGARVAVSRTSAKTAEEGYCLLTISFPLQTASRFNPESATPNMRSMVDRLYFTIESCAATYAIRPIIRIACPDCVPMEPNVAEDWV